MKVISHLSVVFQHWLSIPWLKEATSCFDLWAVMLCEKLFYRDATYEEFLLLASSLPRLCGFTPRFCNVSWYTIVYASMHMCAET